MLVVGRASQKGTMRAIHARPLLLRNQPDNRTQDFAGVRPPKCYTIAPRLAFLRLPSCAINSPQTGQPTQPSFQDSFYNARDQSYKASGSRSAKTPKRIDRVGTWVTRSKNASLDHYPAEKYTSPNQLEGSASLLKSAQQQSKYETCNHSLLYFPFGSSKSSPANHVDLDLQIRGSHCRF